MKGTAVGLEVNQMLCFGSCFRRVFNGNITKLCKAGVTPTRVKVARMPAKLCGMLNKADLWLSSSLQKQVSYMVPHCQVSPGDSTFLPLNDVFHGVGLGLPWQEQW